MGGSCAGSPFGYVMMKSTNRNLSEVMYMEKKLDGIALISFATLLYCLSGKLSDFIVLIGIGLTIPWALITLLIGVVGLVLVFKDKTKSTGLVWLIIPIIFAVYVMLIS